MKRFGFIIIFLLSNLSISLGQNLSLSIGEDLITDIETTMPGITLTSSRNTYGVPVGGMKKTSSGILKVLVVFVRFRDDDVNWADGTSYSTLPEWAAKFVNTSIPSNGIYNDINLTNFFDRASGGDGMGLLGSFQVIGDVIYITTYGKRTDYTTDAAVNQHVLTLLDDPTLYDIDFRKYDNWRFVSGGINYSHDYLPFNETTGVGGDGIVDQMFICYRDASKAAPGAGGYHDISLLSNFNTNDGKTINTNSGSTVANTMYNSGYPSDFYAPAHEYCHYLFSWSDNGNTNGHFDGRTYNNHSLNKGLLGQFSLMQRENNGNLSAYERYRLGWLIPQYFDISSNSILIEDSNVKNDAIMIPLSHDPSGNLIEFFLISNYHSTNDYALADPFNKTEIFDNTLVHGILIFHIENEHLDYATQSDVDIECADGLWNWSLAQGSSTPTIKTDDIITKNISII